MSRKIYDETMSEKLGSDLTLGQYYNPSQKIDNSNVASTIQQIDSYATKNETYSDHVQLQ